MSRNLCRPRLAFRGARIVTARRDDHLGGHQDFRGVFGSRQDQAFAAGPAFGIDWPDGVVRLARANDFLFRRRPENSQGSAQALDAVARQIANRRATAGRAAMSMQHLNQVELSRRWRLSPRTLERWRWLKQGPAYLRLGGRIAYRLEDIEAYEATSLRSTANPLNSTVPEARPS
jgi:hypothetical protein